MKKCSLLLMFSLFSLLSFFVQTSLNERNRIYYDSKNKEAAYKDLINRAFGISKDKIVLGNIFPVIKEFTCMELEAAVQARNSKLVREILQGQDSWNKQTIEVALDRLVNPHILFLRSIENKLGTFTAEQKNAEEATIKGLLSSYLKMWE